MSLAREEARGREGARERAEEEEAAEEGQVRARPAPKPDWSEPHIKKLTAGRWKGKLFQLKKLWADGAGIKDWAQFRTDNFVIFCDFTADELKKKYKEMGEL